MIPKITWITNIKIKDWEKNIDKFLPDKSLDWKLAKVIEVNKLTTKIELINKEIGIINLENVGWARKKSFQDLLVVNDMLLKKGIKCNIFHLLWLKPFNPNEAIIESLKKTKIGLVIDSDFEITGASRSIAYELMHITGASVHALGLEDRVCGVAEHLENITPSPKKIMSTIERLVLAAKTN